MATRTQGDELSDIAGYDSNSRGLSAEEERNYAQQREEILKKISELEMALGTNGNGKNIAEKIKAEKRKIQEFDNLFAERNLGLIMFASKRGKYLYPNLLFSDVLSESQETFARCLPRWDYRRGFKFSTYYVRSCYKAFIRMQQDSMKKRAIRGQSLCDDPQIVDRERDTDRGIQIEELYGALDGLGDRERRVLEYRFGLYGGREMGWDEIGAVVGVSARRLRKVQERALKKLNVHFEK